MSYNPGAGSSTPTPFISEILVPAIAGIKTTDGFLGAGGFMFDPGAYQEPGPGVTRTFEYRAVMALSASGPTGSLVLLREGVTTVATLSTTSSAPEALVAELEGGTDLPDGQTFYVLALILTGGSPGDTVDCYSASLVVRYA